METSNREENKYLQSLVYPNWQNEVRLNLSHKNITDQTLIQLSKYTLPNLKYLDLSYNQITDLGIQYLMRTQLPNLLQLHISGNKIKESLAILFRRRIKSVEIYRNELTGLSINGLLSQKTNLPKILNIAQNNLGSVGVKLFIKLDISQVQFLDISYCKIGYEGQKHLIKAKLNKLSRLYLVQNQKSQIQKQHISCRSLSQLVINSSYVNTLNLVSVNVVSNFRIWNVNNNSQLKNKVEGILKQKFMV